MAMAAADPADLYFCDLDFAHWPLGSASVVEAFHQWVMASSATQCLLLALRFDAMPRQHSRWIKWRQPWGTVSSAAWCQRMLRQASCPPSS